MPTGRAGALVREMQSQSFQLETSAMPRESAAATSQRYLPILTGIVLAAAIITALYWAQIVLLPVAVAILLAFVLSPPVRWLQRHHVPRVLAVTFVVTGAGALLVGLGWLLTNQVTGLLEELPAYTGNIKEKIRSIRSAGPSTGRFEKMVHEIAEELKSVPANDGAVPPAPDGAAAPAPDGANGQPPPKERVVVRPEGPAWLARVPGYLGSVLESLGGLVLVLALTVFMLLKREDMRGRFLRLAGRGHLTTTTKAVDEGCQRISRYLLMQLLLNSTYGVILAVGLYFIGVKYALLWGLLTTVLRYVPYIGAWVVAALLITLSIATSSNWVQPVLVLVLFMTLELIASNVAEPMLYGRSIGVSEVALLIAAAFWAFLWGPIGLVLSGPLTVCLAVLGKFVPQLKFFDVLLGDEPALAADARYYQRLLARDEDEAADLVAAAAKDAPPGQVFDDLLIPALCYAKRDRDRDELTDEDEEYILRTTRTLLEDPDVAPPPAEPGARKGTAKIQLLACPARDEADTLALEMLRRLLDPTRWEVEVVPPETLAAEMVTRAGVEAPAVVCIGALPPGALAHARYLCKRLRAELPGAKIVVGRWGMRNEEMTERNRAQLLEAGADEVATTLAATRDQLTGWLPVLDQEEAKAQAVAH
jgi:predicted PurR-regulated permease PerM